MSPIPPITAADPEAKSADLFAENLSALKALFPQAFTEGGIDFEVLRDLLGDVVDDGEERYGLNWSGKRQARRLALTPSLGTLRPAVADSVDWDTTKNLMIEGDNLEVLKLLQKSYAGQVKMIYIDPPYNTGNDFVYPDDYSENLENYLKRTGQKDSEGVRNTSNAESGGRYHTDWLNMMLPRLELAKRLMRDDGLVVVSIDDAEISSLNMIMNDVFGEENKVACLVWDKNRKNDARLFSVGHEYMLVFAKSLSYLKEMKVRWREKRPGLDEARELFASLVEKHGEDWTAVRKEFSAFYRGIEKDDPRKSIGRFTKVEKRGPYRDDGDISWPGGGGPKYEVLHPKTKQPVKVPAGGWVYPTSEGFWGAHDAGFVVFGEDETTLPRQRRFLFEGDGQVMISVNFSYAQTATMDFVELMGSRVFENPKNWSDIARLASYFDTKDSIVLDFFAGSGTTGHAVMAQNATDGGGRRFILVQLPELLDPANKDQKIAVDFCDSLGKPRTIAELTKERLRRAAIKVKTENPETEFDGGFRAYKLATSNLKAWAPGTGTLQSDIENAIDNLTPGRTEEDLMVELLLKQGIDLTEAVVTRDIGGRRVHAFGGGVLVVCLADIATADAQSLADGIATWIEELNPATATTFFFKDSGFEDNQAKANLAAILSQRLGERLLKVRSL